jgi:hypothetical protein
MRSRIRWVQRGFLLLVCIAVIFTMLALIKCANNELISGNANNGNGKTAVKQTAVETRDV